MSVYEELFLFLAEGADPARDRVEHGDKLLVWVPDGDSAARVADEQASEGVRLIELYRGFDLVETGRVIDAVGDRAPVGVAGGVARGARSATVIYATETTDPADRVVHEHADGTRTTVVGAGYSDAASVALAAVEQGADLIELCGGTPLTVAGDVAAAVGDRVPVAVVSWPFESIDGAAAYKAAYAASA